MNINLRTFTAPTYEKIRAYSDDDGEIRFVAKDLIDLFKPRVGYDNLSEICSDVREIGIVICDRKRLAKVVYDDGVFELAMDSTRQDADRLLLWIRYTVIPSLKEECVINAFISTCFGDADDDEKDGVRAVLESLAKLGKRG